MLVNLRSFAGTMLCRWRRSPRNSPPSASKRRRCATRTERFTGGRTAAGHGSPFTDRQPQPEHSSSHHQSFGCNDPAGVCSGERVAALLTCCCGGREGGRCNGGHMPVADMGSGVRFAILGPLQAFPIAGHALDAKVFEGLLGMGMCVVRWSAALSVLGRRHISRF